MVAAIRGLQEGLPLSTRSSLLPFTQEAPLTEVLLVPESPCPSPSPPFKRSRSVPAPAAALSRAMTDFPPHPNEAFLAAEAGAVESNKKTGKSVHFSTSEPVVYTFSWFDGLTDHEEAQLRSAMWYTRQDFEDFCRDRIDTVRVWRTIGGGDSLYKDLEKYYCLRGLEPYQSSRLNAQLHAQRLLHHQAVASEQARQREAGICDPELLRNKVEKLSSWASERARNSALQDEVELQQQQEKKQPKRSKRRRSCVATVNSSGVDELTNQQQQQQPSKKRHRRAKSSSSLPQNTTAGMSPSAVAKDSFISVSIDGIDNDSPEMLHNSSNSVLISSVVVPASNSKITEIKRLNFGKRVPVDVDRLKQMNVQFLQSMMMYNPTSNDDGSIGTKFSDSAMSTLPSRVSNLVQASNVKTLEKNQILSKQNFTICLESMLLQKHCYQLQQLNLLQQQQHQPRRRHSLAEVTLDHVMVQDGFDDASSSRKSSSVVVMEPPFPIRRDSLHGLKYHHATNHETTGAPTGLLTSSS